MLSDVTDMCTTADCWTARNRSYLGMTAHWRDDNLNQHSVALACKRMEGSHTYDKIATCIDSIHRSWLIHNKVRRVITDNGSNFVKAFRMFGQDDEEEGEDLVDTEPICITDLIAEANEQSSVVLPIQQRCAAHTLNLIAHDAQKAALNRVASSTWIKAQFLWNKQSRSCLKAEQIKSIAGRLLVCPNATRWNSSYDAMACLLTVKSKANRLMDTLGGICFTDEELAYIEEYCSVMKHLAQGLDLLQGDKTVTLGHLLPTVENIRLELTAMEASTIHCQPLVKAVLEGLKKRFTPMYADNDCILAAVVHPMFKLSWIVDNVELETRAQVLFTTEMKKNTSTSVPPPEQEPQDSGMFARFKKKQFGHLSSAYLQTPTSTTLDSLHGFADVKATKKKQFE